MTSLLVMLALITPHPPNVAVSKGHVKPCGHRCQVVHPWNHKLNRMATCESAKRWYLNTGNGFYGGLQFTLPTWHAAGGRGYPHQSSILEQKYRAVRWHNMIHTWVTKAGWPICGYR